MADLIAPLPILNLRSGAEIRFEAIDPTTGAVVNGVTVANAHLWALAVDEDAEDDTVLGVWLQAGRL